MRLFPQITVSILNTLLGRWMPNPQFRLRDTVTSSLGFHPKQQATDQAGVEAGSPFRG